MDITPDEGDASGQDIDMEVDIHDDPTVVIADNDNTGRTTAEAVRATRRRSQPHDGRASSPASKWKYPTNQKRMPLRSRSPTTSSSAPKYQGNCWIRMRPAAAVELRSHATMPEERFHARCFDKEQRQVPSLNYSHDDNSYQMDEDVLYPSPVGRVVANSASSFDDGINPHHAPPAYPSTSSSFNSYQRRQQHGSANIINPTTIRIFFGESGRPISIRSANGYVR
ncbi:hypothetical protein ACHAXA_010028 [Cyclostephanos tholiformis]|uniref:Uncharacterized protein n=1 Tax=Cyclostephanos tholiformis TaxID=382380 RepID=A0ABD3RJX4_9STRA